MKMWLKAYTTDHLVAKMCLLATISFGFLVVLIHFHWDHIHVENDGLFKFIEETLTKQYVPSGHQEEMNVEMSRLMEDVRDQMPNLPLDFWNRHKKWHMKQSPSCANFPNIFDLKFNNFYYQTLETSNGTFQLYAAYLDNRALNMLGPTVRILGMIDRISPIVPTYCQFWFEDDHKPTIVKSAEYKYIWFSTWGNNKQGIYQPYLTACILPVGSRDKVPQAVSLVESPCNIATNLLKVTYDRPETKQDFAVCVKGLDFQKVDSSIRLIEWIELLGLLGVDKIFFYELHVHQNIRKTLKFYEGKGKVHVTPISLAGSQPNWPSLQHLYLKEKVIHKRQNELIPYNDCFYRHMYQYKYITLLDTDEIIMPLKVTTWRGLMDDVLAENRSIWASYVAANVYFLDDMMHNHEWLRGIPKYMHMMQHIYRAKHFTKPFFFVKGFHNTDKVLALHNHMPLACIGGICSAYQMNITDAQLNHYRSHCVADQDCKNFEKNTMKDTNIHRFRKVLVQRVSSTLRTLGYLDNHK